MDKVIPEFSTHTYEIDLSKLRIAFGLKGSYIDDIRSRDRTVKKDDGTNQLVPFIQITTRQTKKDLEAEEELIPKGTDSARG